MLMLRNDYAAHQLLFSSYLVIKEIVIVVEQTRRFRHFITGERGMNCEISPGPAATLTAFKTDLKAPMSGILGHNPNLGYNLAF